MRLARKLLPWLVLVAFETGSQLSLKVGTAQMPDMALHPAWLVEAASQPLIWIGVLCYVGAFLVWMLILARMPLGVAFPASAVVFISIVLVSWLVLGEPIAAFQVVGFLLILGGVLLL